MKPQQILDLESKVRALIREYLEIDNIKFYIELNGELTNAERIVLNEIFDKIKHPEKYKINKTGIDIKIQSFIITHGEISFNNIISFMEMVFSNIYYEEISKK